MLKKAVALLMVLFLILPGCQKAPAVEETSPTVSQPSEQPTNAGEPDSTMAIPAVQESEADPEAKTEALEEREPEPSSDDANKARLEAMRAAAAINWEVDQDDVVVPLDLTDLWDETQGVYAIPGVTWGTDKQTLLDKYGVSVLSEYPINNPELWFTLTLDGVEYRMTPVFGFNENAPSCWLYAKNYCYSAQELEQLAGGLVQTLTDLYGTPALDELMNEDLEYSDNPEEVWHAQFYDWQTTTPDQHTSVLSLAITTCNDMVQEIELDLFYRPAS